MDYSILLAGLCAVHLVALASPGPNLFIVIQAAASRTRSSGVTTALGVASGAGIWATTALVGLSVVLTQGAWLYSGLKLLGGLYLLYLGTRLWRSARGPIAFAADNRPVFNTWQAYRLGLFTTLTNPKAALFFAGLFTGLPAVIPMWVKWVAIGIIIANSALFHIALALFFSQGRVQQLYGRGKIWLDRTAGGLLMLLGVWLAIGYR